LRKEEDYVSVIARSKEISNEPIIICGVYVKPQNKMENMRKIIEYISLDK
jgi:hypothetical protein